MIEIGIVIILAGMLLDFYSSSEFMIYLTGLLIGCGVTLIVVSNWVV